jgi:hypothetical protein
MDEHPLVRQWLKPGEVTQVAVDCVWRSESWYEGKRRPGVLLLTDRGLVFCSTHSSSRMPTEDIERIDLRAKFGFKAVLTVSTKQGGTVTLRGSKRRYRTIDELLRPQITRA